jgi:hypothetical protein
VEITFVASTGRCGSTMLSRILHRHPDVLSVSEFCSTLSIATRRFQLPMDDLDGKELWQALSSNDSLFDAVTRAGWDVPELCYPYDRGRYDRAGGVPIICNTTLPMITDDPDALFDELAAEVPDWPRRPAAEQYRALFEWLAGRLGRTTIVERSGNGLAHIPAMREGFPDARYVHMYREGPDCALSMSRHPMFRRGALALRAAAAVTEPVASVDELERLLPEEFTGLVVPPFDGRRIMEYDIPVASFGEMWTTMVNIGLAALAELPEDAWTSLKYEDLLRDPEGELTRLAAFLGIPPAPEWFEAAERLIDPRRAGKAARLDAETAAALEDSCRPGMDAIAAALSKAGKG